MRDIRGFVGTVAAWQCFTGGTWINYRWTATGEFPEFMEVLSEEMPCTVPESGPWYQRVPLFLPRIVSRIIFNWLDINIWCEEINYETSMKITQISNNFLFLIKFSSKSCPVNLIKLIMFHVVLQQSGILSTCNQVILKAKFIFIIYSLIFS